MPKEEKNLSEEEYAEFLKLRELGEKIKETIEEGKKATEVFKDEILKKYNWISAIGLIAPMANKVVEENMEDEERERLEQEKKQAKDIFHVFIIAPDDKIKEIPKLSIDSIRLVKDKKPKLWLHFLTPQQIWQLCFDAKYSYVEAIAMCLPIYDTGLLSALRVATIHKMMVISKFERYVVSYVLAGSLVRGQATKTSDVDVFIVIDDTDVKKMSRFELRERLRSIIYSYAIEANERANAKNKLSPQIYILTEFWEAVKEAHPVIFTFIRDGVPLYDRGAFMPWKLLLKMGKIKPSPEAIEMFMGLGEKVVENVKKKINSLITEDIYWGVITPSQAALMLYGISPPTPRETVKLMNEIFVKKEKLLEKNYIDILSKIVEIYKKYEHEQIKEIKGKDIDFLLDQVSAYIDRLKKLSEKLEERSRRNIVKELKTNLKNILNKIYGKKPMNEYIKLLEKDFVDKGYISKFYLDSIKKFMMIDKTKKFSAKDFDLLRKDITELLRELKEYIERKEILERSRRRIKIKYKKGTKVLEGEIILAKEVFLIPNIVESKIEKYSYEDGKFIQASEEELKEAINEMPKEAMLSERIIEELRKRFKDFELIF